MNRLRTREGFSHLNCPTYRALFAINEKSFVYEYQNPFVLCIHLHVLIVFWEILIQLIVFPCFHLKMIYNRYLK